MTKRRALGRGLSAIIPEADNLAGQEGQYFQCPVEDIEPNPLQPRQDFREEDIEELVQSLKETGVITPLLVSKTSDGYRLIAGERRWRAAQKAGLDRVPVVIRETTPTESLELALIENIHRKDLNPIEEALAYSRWLEDTHMTQEVLAKKLGKDRTTITNMLRLLNLPREVQKDVIEGRLTMGHARVLVGLNSGVEQQALRDRIIKGALSVRQTEALVRRSQSKKRPKNRQTERDYYINSLSDDLKRSLGTKVDIRRHGKQGSIIIHFYSDEEFDRLLERLT